MNKRSPVSGIQNKYFDSEQLDENDLTLEQNYNNAFQTGLINNHIGNGVLPNNLVNSILFDSSKLSGLLDGKALSTFVNQPSDTNYGNQLEITLSDSKAAGKKTVKVAIIGLNFEGNLQYDTFVFNKNESQITSKHYVSLLLVLTNDLLGQTTQSFNLGGKVLIKEALPFTVSRDPIMVSQAVEPNLFWRDFFVSGYATLQALLTASLPLYNIDNLGINTGFLQYTPLNKGDVSSQVGEKFLATSNNIQKITLLMGVQNTDNGQASVLTWHGDLIVSIYPLQSAVELSTDIVPNLAIDYSPSNIPLAQISINYSSLQAQGITLDGNAQPVDFIFSNTPVASGNSIVPGNYYVFTVKRSGSADLCDLLLATGSSYSSTSRLTSFNGSLWVDLPEQELWFKIYTDAVKVSDGQAYETGHGITIPKTNADPDSGATVDYSLNNIQFTGNSLYTAVVSANTQLSVEVQDQRTGNPVKSRQGFVPSVSLLNTIDLSNLQKTTQPFVIGVVEDQNEKSFDQSSSTLTATLHNWNFINNKLFISTIADSSSPYYDPNVNVLKQNLINGDFTKAKIIPNISNPSVYYKIAKAELVSTICGDLNGDGIVDEKDLALVSSLVGFNLTKSPPATTSYNSPGDIVNGYSVYTKPFVNASGLSFLLINQSSVVVSGTDGVLAVNPNDNNKATFQSASTDFSAQGLVGNFKLFISSGNNPENFGVFPISGINSSSNNVLDISKLYLDDDKFAQILSADIDSDFIISSNDVSLLQNYINKVLPFPATSLPASRIGQPTEFIKLTLDPFVYNDTANSILDRNDDFPSSGANRATTLHKTQDVFANDTNLQNHVFSSNPITFNIIKQFSWDESLIAVNSKANFVPAVFVNSFMNGSTDVLVGIKYQVYPSAPDFTPATIDLFAPNNVILNGNLLQPDGNFYKVDFEVGTIVFEIPDGFYGVERTIDVFNNFVVDSTGFGITTLGLPAMKFADGTYVSSMALALSQVQFSASVQSFSPNTNGVSSDGYSGVIVDGKMGVAMDYATGLLTLNFTNLYQDEVLSTLNTKIQINVFLKKAGFNNIPVFIDSDKLENMLSILTSFTGVESGTNIGQLPASVVQYNPVASSDWDGNPPSTIQEALDRIAAKIGPIS